MIWLWLFIAIIGIFFGLVVFRGAPYVPSLRTNIKQALRELYPLNSDDVLVDIGSGDGVVLREASITGARAIGYEINPFLVFISRFLSRNDSRVSVHLADFWLTNLPDDTTIVYVFSVKRDVYKIAKKLQKETNRLGRPLNLISFGFEIGDIKPVKNVGAYHLYQFHPLQPGKPQV